MTVTVEVASGNTTGRGVFDVELPGSGNLHGDITTAAEWIATRYAVSVNALVRLGWSAADAERGSLVAVAIWMLENARGNGEWHWNVGNIHCTPGTSAKCTTVTGHNGPERLVAWDNIVQGVGEWWALIGRRYSAAVNQFKAGDVLAWNTLRCGGYGGSSVTATDALSLYNECRRTIDATRFPPVSTADANRTRNSWIAAADLASCRFDGVNPTPTVPGATPGTITPGGGGGGSSSSGGGGMFFIIAAILAAVAFSSQKKRG